MQSSMIQYTNDFHICLLFFLVMSDFSNGPGSQWKFISNCHYN